MLSWEKLICQQRRKHLTRKDGGDNSGKTKPPRTETERDHDRILFSTPVRRLADKTQVFPFERKDSVRTRLTHSLEVSNIARSIGVNLVFNHETLFPESINPKRNIPAMLAAIGLAHDLGNPPFGHQGESAIQTWFKDHEDDVLGKGGKYSLTDEMRNDFLKFEGNAQTLRLLTRLQILDDEFGLDLTCGTLAAMMKYTVPSSGIDKKSGIASKKKHGFFQSEKNVVDEIFNNTGLKEGLRHPLTYIMEAADDIAYSVLDVEDAVKKELLSFHDIMGYLNEFKKDNQIIEKIHNDAMAKHKKYKMDNPKLSPSELNEISTQRFRVFAIDALVTEVTNTFVKYYDSLMEGAFHNPLLEKSDGNKLYEELKTLAKNHAYTNKKVLGLELMGNNKMHELMDILWGAIIDRVDMDKKDSKRNGPFTRYVYRRISEGYRRVFENNALMPIRYAEAQLLTDMISGMTDNYLVDLNDELKNYKN